MLQRIGFRLFRHHRRVFQDVSDHIIIQCFLRGFWMLARSLFEILLDLFCNAVQFIRKLRTRSVQKVPHGACFAPFRIHSERYLVGQSLHVAIGIQFGFQMNHRTATGQVSVDHLLPPPAFTQGIHIGPDAGIEHGVDFIRKLDPRGSPLGIFFVRRIIHIPRAIVAQQIRQGVG